jgi:hypothetical protein
VFFRLRTEDDANYNNTYARTEATYNKLTGAAAELMLPPHHVGETLLDKRPLHKRSPHQRSGYTWLFDFDGEQGQTTVVVNFDDEWGYEVSLLGKPAGTLNRVVEKLVEYKIFGQIARTKWVTNWCPKGPNHVFDKENADALLSLITAAADLDGNAWDEATE